MIVSLIEWLYSQAMWFSHTPGRYYVLATLLPVTAFLLLLLGGGIRSLVRPLRRTEPSARFLYYLLGGDRPLRAGAYFATVAIALSALLAIVGLINYLDEYSAQLQSPTPTYYARWAENTTWASIGPTAGEHQLPAVQLKLGYRIDHLTAILFAMVTVISTCIFLFSLGYMRDETEETVTDHEVHLPDHTHLQRRGRYGRFFLFLSLFCFSMLNLLIADNLFQVFISWELVGVCSYFLIGFYYERHSASTAANKAFIVNRIGDAGFLIGLAIVWSYFGTFNFLEIQGKLRCPDSDAHRKGVPVQLAGTILRGERMADQPRLVQLTSTGSLAVLIPDHFHAGPLEKGIIDSPDPLERNSQFAVMPYWLLIVAGLGIFLGCAGKSAQVPLQTWLPDAMEGPTPVSALIHAATMVAAGVYLVGRVYPLFTPEVLLVIAYVGAITLFIAASIALVQHDIKRVLAYSTVSQLGYMMLSLGVGGWTPGLLHLLTHAFFKALLFLAAGAVIFGLHHQQDLRKMGGLSRKMPITAFTMLIGVLAIVGTPFFSGWYSKDQIIGQALGFGLTYPKHLLLAILPIVGAGLTGFYMFRLWLLVFTGTPRDAHAYEHAHESPWVMTLPLCVLAIFSLGIAWGPQFWSPEGSYVGQLIEKSEPDAVVLGFGKVIHAAHEHHLLAGGLALAAALVGVGIALAAYSLRRFDIARWQAALPGVHRFLERKWYFDELYNVLLVRSTVMLAFALSRFDKRTAAPGDADAADRRVDPSSLDGAFSAVGLLMHRAGLRLREVQSGLLRRYVLVLILTTVVMFAILSILIA